MIQAVIFDMDGTLIDSEPMWKEAEKQVFSSVGVKVSERLSANTASMTTRQVTEYWYQHYPWSGKSLEQVENEVIDRVEALIGEQGKAMKGVKHILDFFQQKGFKIALATNSPSRLIPVVLNKLAIADYFHVISSAEDEITGKPHPAIYLSTATKLNVEPERCIAFEDSVSGIISAKKANITTVAIPSHLEFSDKKFNISDIKLNCLADFTDLQLRKISTAK